MTNSLEVSEAEAAAIAKSPIRISLADIEKKIVGEYYWTADRLHEAMSSRVMLPEYIDALRVLTICVLVTESGFTFVGKSAPVEPSNFNAEFGKKLAREDAVRQIWPMEGYLLRDKIARECI